MWRDGELKNSLPGGKREGLASGRSVPLGSIGSSWWFEWELGAEWATRQWDHIYKSYEQIVHEDERRERKRRPEDWRENFSTSCSAAVAGWDLQIGGHKSSVPPAAASKSEFESRKTSAEEGASISCSMAMCYSNGHLTRPKASKWPAPIVKQRQRAARIPNRSDNNSGGAGAAGRAPRRGSHRSHVLAPLSPATVAQHLIGRKWTGVDWTRSTVC